MFSRFTWLYIWKNIFRKPRSLAFHWRWSLSFDNDLMIFLQTFSLNFQNVRICLTFDFYEGKRFFLSVTSEFERIDGLTSLMGTVWVKALFFLYFRLLFSFRISNQDFIRLKSDSIILITWFNTFLRICGWYFECFRVGVFKSLENWKILHLGAVKSYNMKWIEDKDNIPRLL